MPLRAQWTDSSWVELGEVVDGESTPVEAPRTMYEGVEYTHVFDVDIKEGAPPLKLPYNLGDDVSEVASAFVALHSLPLVYLSQIEDFISASTR
jgi:phospholipase A-2-activating protein